MTGREFLVRVHLDIDGVLLAESMRLAGTTNKQVAIETALRELIKSHKMRRVMEQRGRLNMIGELPADLRPDAPMRMTAGTSAGVAAGFTGPQRARI
jgi:Arc/MetJ family transcription regulator